MKNQNKLMCLRLKGCQVWLLVCCLILVFPVITTFAQDYSELNGEWIRPDGGYILQVRNARADGSVDAAYFNPGPINVAEAKVSMRQEMKTLFVKLQDKGYPGSTYTLYYFADKDALAGFYFQANMGQTFEVVFVRKQ